MKNLVCVILFFLLAGIYNQVKAAGCSNDQDCMVHVCDGNRVPYCRTTVVHHHHHTNITGTCHCKAGMSCIYNNDCHGYGCGSRLYPQCANLNGHFLCHCEASSPSARHECQQSSDCTKCPQYQVGKCNNNQCTCSAEMSCIYNKDCHGYGCGSSLYPQCANLHGHSRCLCEASSPSARHECDHSSNCTKCPGYQVGKCNNTQCTCSAGMSCIYNNDCHGYGCGSRLYPQCANLNGHFLCHCEASSPSARHECQQSSDCTKCPKYQVGKCNNTQCTCSAEMSCIYNNDCHGYGCGSSLYPQCANLHGHSRCLCETSSPSARHECQQSSDCTKCPGYKVGKCNNTQCTCSAGMSCIYNNDCHGYGCGSSLYPQCAGRHGHSRCHCRASSPSTRHECDHSSNCTKCPEYQVGLCNNNQCTCSAGMSCIYNNDCHEYGCGRRLHPECANLRLHHSRCLCEAKMSCIYNNDCHADGCGSRLYPQCANLHGHHSRCLCEASSPSARHECQQSSDCTKCPKYQVGKCNNTQCTCSAGMSCIYNNDCHGYGCGSSLYPQCANLHGHSRCLCEASSPSARHECQQSSDCTKCPKYQVGKCSNNQCTCSVCTEHSHCLCPQGLIAQCHFDFIHNSHRCICGLAPDTTIKTTSTTAATTITSATIKQGIQCPTCDESLNCVWNQTCYPEESCMIGSYNGTKFTVHCSRKENCTSIKDSYQSNGEVFCCNDRHCVRKILGL